MTLPGETPEVELEVSPGKLSAAVPHLNTVVFRLPLNEVEMLWSARVEVPSELTSDDLESVRRVVTWKRPGRESKA